MSRRASAPPVCRPGDIGCEDPPRWCAGRCRFQLRAKGVDGRVGALTHVNGLLDISVAGVIFAIREEQDKVSAAGVIDFAKLVKTGLVDGSEDGCATDAALPNRGKFANACGQCKGVAGPGLCDLRQVTKIHDEGQVSLL